MQEVKFWPGSALSLTPLFLSQGETHGKLPDYLWGFFLISTHHLVSAPLLLFIYPFTSSAGDVGKLISCCYHQELFLFSFLFSVRKNKRKKTVFLTAFSLRTRAEVHRRPCRPCVSMSAVVTVELLRDLAESWLSLLSFCVTAFACVL